jgi:hypothetical protein
MVDEKKKEWAPYTKDGVIVEEHELSELDKKLYPNCVQFKVLVDDGHIITTPPQNYKGLIGNTKKGCKVKVNVNDSLKPIIVWVEAEEPGQ